MSALQIIAYLGQALLLLNVIVYFKSYSLRGVTFKIFTIYLAFMLFIQALTSYYYEIGGDNLFLSHFYFIIQFILLSLFFYRISRIRFQKIVILFSLISILVVLAIYYIFNPEKYYAFNVLEIIITSVPLIIFCLFILIQKIDGNKKFVYITSGFFLYIVCSTLLFSTGNIDAGIKKTIWYSNNILYVIYQILIFIEWYKNFRKKKEPTEITT